MRSLIGNQRIDLLLFLLAGQGQAHISNGVDQAWYTLAFFGDHCNRTISKDQLHAGNLLQAIGKIGSHLFFFETRQHRKDLDAVFEHVMLRLIDMS